MNGGPVLAPGSAPVAFIEDPQDQAAPAEGPVLDLDVLPGMAPRRKKSSPKQPNPGRLPCQVLHSYR